MRKLVFAFTTILFIMLFANAVFSLEWSRANFLFPISLPTITIQEDGAITPKSDYLKQNGCIYTLASDMAQQYGVVIKCSNIVFDGQGYCINGSVAQHREGYSYGYNNYGIALEGVTNVTVRDATIVGFTQAHVYLNGSYAVSLRGLQTLFINLVNSENNTIENTKATLFMKNSSNNLFVRNDIIISGSSLIQSSNNVFFDNRITCKSSAKNIGTSNQWDNGSLGNYWTDYGERYKQAIEVGSSGIGSIPYYLNENNTDYYPIMRSVEGTSFPRQDNTLLPLGYLPTITLVIIITAVVFVSLVYLKRRKKLSSKPGFL
jgi:hypothetical protein